MKYLILKITCLFLLGCITLQAQNDLQKENLKGSVRLVTTTEYHYTDSKKGAGEIKVKLQFNDKGNKTEETSYSNNNPKNQLAYSYNSAQKLIETTMLHLKAIVDYDEYGDEIKTGKTRGEVYGATIYTYDDNGNCIEARVEYPKGNLSSKTVYTYDEKGNRLSIHESMANGTFKKRSASKYNEKNNNTETTNYLADGKVEDVYKYTYDANGNQLEWSDYNPAGILTFKRAYKYDDKGNWTELAKYNEDGSLYEKYVKTYDDKGNELTETIYGSDGVSQGTTTYVYVFDASGNWTSKQTVFDAPYSVEEHVLEYY